MRYSKSVLEVYDTIKNECGILQCDLSKKLPHRHYSTVRTCLQALVGTGMVERVPASESFRLYLNGKVPPTAEKEIKHMGNWQEKSPINKAKGDKFIEAFDKEFNLKPIILQSSHPKNGGTASFEMYDTRLALEYPLVPSSPCLKG